MSGRTQTALTRDETIGISTKGEGASRLFLPKPMWELSDVRHGLLAAFGFVVASGLTWKRYRRMQRERSSIPLSPTEYVEASKHNLSLLERENRFTRWIFPIVIPFILAANMWIYYELYEVYAMSAGSIGLLIAVMTILLGYACWKAYIIKPAELKAERAALQNLESDLHTE